MAGENKGNFIKEASEPLRDIFVVAIMRGQLLPVTCAVIIIILVARLPSDILGQLTLAFFSNLKRYSGIGYFLAVIVIVGWYIHVKILNNLYNSEMKRISAERNRLQGILKPGTTQSTKEV